MYQGEGFIYGTLGGYEGARINNRFQKGDKELFKGMINHGTERYKQLSDEGTDKEEFRDKVNDILIDFFIGRDFGDRYKYVGYYETAPFGEKRD